MRTAGRVREVLVLLVSALAAGCTGLGVSLPMDAPAGLEARGKAYELRFRREAGSLDRYQAMYRVRVRDGVHMDEDFTAELLAYATGKTEGPEVFDRVLLRRREVERSLLEVGRNGRVQTNKSLRDEQPAVTPNSEPEPGGGSLRYLPVDDLGRVARRPETPYHYALYDSLCYLMPVLPRNATRLGDEWVYTLPVVCDANANAVVELHAAFRFADLREADAAGRRLCAVIEHRYWGILDSESADNRAKVTLEKGCLSRRYAISGEGLTYFDVERGKVVWRREEYKITRDEKFEQPPKEARKGNKKDVFRAPWEHSRDAEPDRWVSTLEFAARLLAPGERAQDRPSRTDR